MRRWFVVAALLAALLLLLPAAAGAKAAAYANPGSAAVIATYELGDGSTAMLYADAADLGPDSSCMVAYVVYTLVDDEPQFSFWAQGEAALTPPAFRVTGGALTRATLTATVPLSTFDVFPPEGVTGTPWGYATVNLSWTGTGPISVDRQHYTLIDEETGLPFTIITHGRSREATVTGTVLLPDDIGWDLTALSDEEKGGFLLAGHEVNISYRH